MEYRIYGNYNAYEDGTAQRSSKTTNGKLTLDKPNSIIYITCTAQKQKGET
jgi:hypothetical protein